MNALFIYLKIYKSKQFKNMLYFVYKKKLIAQDQIFYYMCFPKNKFKRAERGFGIVKNMERKNCDKAENHSF